MTPHSLPTFAFWARTDYDRVAMIGPDGAEHRVFEVQATANRLARNLLALGCQPGDAVAVSLHNTPEILTLALATAQVGLYLVPISWHLAARELAHILSDSGARILICDAEVAARCSRGLVPLYVPGGAPGCHDLVELSAGDAAPPDSRTAGGVMTYTSGTTGLPKGVRRPLPPAPPEPVASAYAMFLLMYGMKPDEGVHLVVSPLYHTAVLYFATSALHLGHQVVVMDAWTPEGMLQRVEQFRVTSSHMVPTQFVRLLDLPNRLDFDTSSLRHMVHSAAPCPVPVKHAMLQWWGPCIYEYYAASEGGGTMVRPDEWLARPGTVGRPWQTAEIAIFDDSGHRLGPATIGTVYIKMAQAFVYHRDTEKTEKAWRTDGYFTVGDAGYLDTDGYLFLCDRKADMIISGGVNIYPAEIESVLSAHPRVLDIAVFGIPDARWGEQVKAVVETKGGVPAAGEAEALAAELTAWCKERVAGFKCPRSFEFVASLPREPNGKLKKRLLRDPYWKDTGRSI